MSYFGSRYLTIGGAALVDTFVLEHITECSSVLSENVEQDFSGSTIWIALVWTDFSVDKYLFG